MKLKDYVFRALALGLFVYWGMSSIVMDVSINQVFAQDKATQDMINHLEQLLEATGSYRTDVATIFEDGKEINGKVKFKWPNMRWQENRFPRKHGSFHTVYIISNGTIRWNYMPGLNIALKYDKKARHEDAQQKGWFSADIIDKASLQYVRKEQLDGEEVSVFESKPSALLKHENPDPPGTTRFYIGAKDGIMRKIVTYNPEGRETGSQIFSNIRIDPSISDKDFEFDPPEGTQIHEVKEVDQIIRIPFRAIGK